MKIGHVLGRRAVLRGSAGVAIALPCLQAMQARAATRPPKRFIVFNQNNGNVFERWVPTGGETNFMLSEILAPLTPHRQKLLIIAGLDNLAGKNSQGAPHMKVFGPMLTGAGLGPGTFVPGGTGAKGHGYPKNISVDQRIARHIGAGARFSSLELGVQVDARDHVETRISYREVNQPLPPENDPRKALVRLFSGGSATPGDRTALLRRISRRQSMLDHVREDHRRLSSQLGAEDAQRLGLHLESIRELEQRLARDLASATGGGATCAAPSGTFPAGHACTEPEQAKASGNCSDQSYGDVGRAHIDLMTLAMACDLTRVSSLQWSNSGNRIIFNKSLGLAGTHHDLDHQPNLGTRTAMCVWYAKQFAYLLDRLAAQPEVDGSTLLDNTLVLWTVELGNGDSHSPLNMPYVLAGGAQGSLRTGRFLRFSGRAHNDLLVSCMNAFGIQEGTFGEAAYNKGPLPGLT